LRPRFELLTLPAHVPTGEAREHSGARHVGGTATLAELFRGDLHEGGFCQLRKIAPRDPAPDQDIDDGLQPLPSCRENLGCRCRCHWCGSPEEAAYEIRSIR